MATGGTRFARQQSPQQPRSPHSGHHGPPRGQGRAHRERLEHEATDPPGVPNRARRRHFLARFARPRPQSHRLSSVRCRHHGRTPRACSVDQETWIQDCVRAVQPRQTLQTPTPHAAHVDHRQTGQDRGGQAPPPGRPVPALPLPDEEEPRAQQPSACGISGTPFAHWQPRQLRAPVGRLMLPHLDQKHRRPEAQPQPCPW